MISRSPLRPPASLFSKHGVCLFCRASKLQAPLARGYASRPRPSPFTRTREREKEPINKNRSAEELVARQLGHKYIPGSEHEPRLPMEIFVQAYRSGRIRIPPGPAQRILRDFEPVMKKASAATTLLSMCSGREPRSCICNSHKLMSPCRFARTSRRPHWSRRSGVAIQKPT